MKIVDARCVARIHSTSCNEACDHFLELQVPEHMMHVLEIPRRGHFIDSCRQRSTVICQQPGCK